jgi:transposase InsO family protein
MENILKSHKKVPSAVLAYFPSKKITIDLWESLRKAAVDFPPVVAKRLEWCIFYETIAKKDASYTSSYFNISRKTFHKWYGLFKHSHYKLNTLTDRSKAPIHKRTWQVSIFEEELICGIRKKHLRYGKKKIKRIAFRDYNVVISTWKIERVVRKHNLYPDPVKNKRMQVKRAKRRANPRVRVHSLPKPQSVGALWHIDSIVLYFDGIRRAIITGIDEVSKIAYGRMYLSNTSTYAKDFIQRLMYLTDGNIQVVHTDNGSEFDGYFDQAVRELNIPRVYSRPHTPKDNPVGERFNRTIQDDWLDGAIFDPGDLEEANKLMTDWLIEYNTYRPHEALDQLTPIEYVEATLKVLPMYPTHTAVAQTTAE